MTRENWARVRPLLEAALEKAPPDRVAFLAQMCGDDGELRLEVEQLLAMEAEADSLFASERWDLDGLEPDPVGPGARVGAYRILQPIGGGGMGTVYLAERADEVYTQRVAMKIVQRNLWQRDSVRRFVEERQILARLNHSGIARLLDGGVTPDGRPYLVMEYVEGRPLTEYCDEKGLSVRERIALLLRVCDAVQTAHQNLIIHRDLKPGNILVKENGEPKLLDFGIAKCLDAAAGVASHATVQILTPSYASPEQAANEPVSTASDVYSLGALLYELLTGAPPHQVNGLPLYEAIRILSECEPAAASSTVTGKAAALRNTTAKALRRTLEGDLDNVLQQALRREPARRYPTVQALAADLRHYLAGLPVSARRDTFVYRASKFIVRRKAAMAVLAAFLAVVALAGAGMWHSYSVAQVQRTLAETRYRDGQTLVHSYLFEIDPQVESLPASAPVRNLIAQRSLEYLDRMSSHARGDLDLQRELAQAYYLVARSQGMTSNFNLGDRRAARINMDKAVRLRRAVFAANPGSLDDRAKLAYALGHAGNVAVQGGDVTQALVYHREACALAQPVFAGPAKGGRWLQAMAACWYLATDYNGNGPIANLGDFEKGLKGQLETLARSKQWAAANPENPHAFAYIGMQEKVTGDAFSKMGRYREASGHYLEAIAVLKGTHVSLSDDLHLSYLVQADGDFAMSMADMGRYKEALPYAEEALALVRRRSDVATLPGLRWQLLTADAEVAMGRLLLVTGKKRQGFALLASSLPVLDALYARDPLDSQAAGVLVRSALRAGDAAAWVHEAGFARRRYTQVIAICRAAFQQHPENAFAGANLAAAQRRLKLLER